jgi:hypothetical protein
MLSGKHRELVAVVSFTKDGLDGWTFVADEVSPGVYRVHGRHYDRRSVERQGTDYEAVKADCINDALTIGEGKRAHRT